MNKVMDADTIGGWRKGCKRRDESVHGAWICRTGDGKEAKNEGEDESCKTE